jgi:uncharacterized repeat protein (TIGR01451 family)
MRVKVILLLSLFCLSTAFSADPEVSISSITVSDQGINQGGSGSITFIVTNTGDTDLTNIKVVLSSGLTLSPGSFSYHDIQVGESRLITASYSAPTSLSSGDYSIIISVDYNFGDEQYSNQDGAVIKVLKTNYLVVSGYTTNLIIDTSNTFIINVTNQGDSALNDLLLDLILPDGFIPTTGSQFFFDSLGVGDSAVFTTQVFIEKGVEPDSFQFLLVKSADDYNDSDVLNVVVSGVPLISFSGLNLDPEIPVSGGLQTISVQLENVGSGKAYNVVAELDLSTDVTGVTMEYLGTLDRDDLTSAIFDFYVPIGGARLTGEVIVSYTDAAGTLMTNTQSIDFNVVQQVQDNMSTYLIGGAVLLVVGYLIYKRYKKK